MSASGQEGRRVQYTTPRWVQVWFLRNSRDNWKEKYKQLKVNAKRLQNRVNDVTKSRHRWRAQNEELTQRVGELEAENAALQKQLAALKKEGRVRVAGLAR